MGRLRDIPKRKMPKMGSDLARDLQREKELCQKKLAPKKRTVPPKHDARRKEDPDRERDTMIERKPPSQRGTRRLHWHHLGTVAPQEIQCYQKPMELLIWKLLFTCLTWELSKDYHPGNRATESYSWQGSAIRVLQEASKYVPIGLLEDANLCVIHAKHITIQPRDLQLAQWLQGRTTNKWRTEGKLLWYIESGTWLDVHCVTSHLLVLCDIQI